jgi:septal ring factor EnvC (AmiA/AmiB activator)
MRKPNKHIAMLMACVMVFNQLPSQTSRKELEKQRKKTEEQIALTKKILKETKSKKQKSLKEIVTISRLIETREELISTIKTEIVYVNRDVENKKNEIDSLNSQLDREKKNYARAIVQSYKSKKVYNNALYLFAARSFNQLFQRIRFNRYLAGAQEKFLVRIEEKRNLLNVKLKDLLGLKESKQKLSDNKERELKELEVDKKEKNRVVIALTGKEAELKASLEKQKKAKENLNAQINAIIAREIAAARKKAAEEAAKKGKTTKPPGEKKKPGEVVKPEPKVPTVTPEVKLLSDNFAANKGKLPWPVEKGFISERFGTHTHAKLDQVKIQNNGIDIQTNAGSSARCIHKGTVTAIINIPGMGKAVLVNHGEYYTVYSKLKDISVSQGQEIGLKQVIGTIAEDEDGATEIHFEIWYNQEKQNPESWLAKK